MNTAVEYALTGMIVGLVLAWAFAWVLVPFRIMGVI